MFTFNSIPLLIAILILFGIVYRFAFVRWSTHRRRLREQEMEGSPG